jgi:methylaspartate ammonia-lyase
MIYRLKKKTENLNDKIFFMKKENLNEKENPATESIVIADECGDSMWDAVLQQEVKACEVKAVTKNASSLLNRIDAAQACDAKEAK